MRITFLESKDPGKSEVKLITIVLDYIYALSQQQEVMEAIDSFDKLKTSTTTSLVTAIISKLMLKENEERKLRNGSIVKVVRELSLIECTFMLACIEFFVCSPCDDKKDIIVNSFYANYEILIRQLGEVRNKIYQSMQQSKSSSEIL